MTSRGRGVWLRSFCHFFCLLGVSAGAAGERLSQVQVLFRHGDRYPELTTTDDSLGTLTPVGKKQMYDLGLFLRERYGSLIGEGYESGGVEVISSDKDRAIRSGQLVAYGLFKSWNVGASWSSGAGTGVQLDPVPVRRIPRELDSRNLGLLRPGQIARPEDFLYIQLTAPCPKHRALLLQVVTRFTSEFLQENSEFVQKFVEGTGNTDALNESLPVMGRLDPIIMLQEQVTYNVSQGLRIEDWALEYLTNPSLISIRTDYIQLYIETPQLQRLYAGPFLDLLLRNFEARRTKMSLFAGHDRILLVLMATLGLWKGGEQGKPPPPVGATLFLELYDSSDTSSFVKILYRNDNSLPPVPMDIPGCPSPCPWSSFSSMLSHLRPINLAEECLILSDE